MAEELVLTAPDVIQPEIKNTKYQVVVSTFNWEAQHIQFHLKGEGGRIMAEYGGPMATQAERDQATQMMRQLNTANNSTKSMQKRILEKLTADGKIPPGTVSGTPDPVTP